MAAIGKRKRPQHELSDSKNPVVSKKKHVVVADAIPSATKTPKTRAPTSIVRHDTNPIPDSNPSIHVQIVTGSYERVLHGITASIPVSCLESSPSANDTTDQVAFTNNFLFAAHASAIRCLAVSPATDAGTCYLATGSSDERINVYSLSTASPSSSPSSKPSAPLPVTLGNGPATHENPRNRALGSLLHHSRAVTHLDFASHAKLFSGAEDNTVAIARTRDWTVLSSIKAPIPAPHGRPSGDTAAPGETPAGINAFAIHPSQKLMLSVSRAERCLRLWNLMTGKKAGVLNFDRTLLSQVGESGPVRLASGEARGVQWDGAGEHFVVRFDRAAAVFGLDCKPLAVMQPPAPATKLHALYRVPLANTTTIFAASTEDARILIYDIIQTLPLDSSASTPSLPQCRCIAQIPGRTLGLTSRIKDFAILPLSVASNSLLLFVAACSDGRVQLWSVPTEDLQRLSEASVSEDNGEAKPQQPPAIGASLASLETGSRITCLAAFELSGKALEGSGEKEGDGAGDNGVEDEEDSGDSE